MSPEDVPGVRLHLKPLASCPLVLSMNLCGRNSCPHFTGEETLFIYSANKYVGEFNIVKSSKPDHKFPVSRRSHSHRAAQRETTVTCQEVIRAVSKGKAECALPLGARTRLAAEVACKPGPEDGTLGGWSMRTRAKGRRNEGREFVKGKIAQGSVDPWKVLTFILLG